MGRPLKIKQSTTVDVGFNSFSTMDQGTAVIPTGMTSSQFLGVVGGANVSIASNAYPVVAIVANVNGQQGNAYIIIQKGTRKYLVSGENSVATANITPGFSYQITSLGTTNWTAVGAGVNATVGKVFTATSAAAGTGTVSNAGQCVLVATNAISSGQMYMTFSAANTTSYASRLTNKFIYDSSNNRYAVNFFATGNTASASTTFKSGADVATFAGNNGNLTLAQVSSYTS